MRSLAIGLIAFACLPAAMAAASSGGAVPASAPAAPERTWRATCGYCHGGPMRAIELRGLGLPEDLMFRTARAGAAGMPPFHPSAIGDAELRALVRWIAMQPAPAARPEPLSQPAPKQ